MIDAHTQETIDKLQRQLKEAVVRLGDMVTANDYMETAMDGYRRSSNQWKVAFEAQSEASEMLTSRLNHTRVQIALAIDMLQEGDMPGAIELLTEARK